MAESGKEASFLAGGEFPVPVAQGSGANIGVSVQFKEFGIRLNFTPTVNGDRVHLKVRPEVSTLDYGNAILLSGFRIPSLQTRRAETSVELVNGQTFAIAGLMNNQMQQTMQKVPGLGDIPILGYLFRSKASQRDQTELVVMITPEILPSNSPGVTPSLPQYPDTFLPPLSELKNPRPAPAPAFTDRSRAQATTPAGTPVADNRTEVEKAQDRALAAIDGQPNQQPVAAAAPVAPQAAQSKAVVAPQGVATEPGPQPVALVVAPEAVAPSSEATKQASAEAVEMTKEQRELMKAAREQAARDAKAAEKARKEEEKRAAKAQAEAEKLAREQAKRDAEAAKKQAKPGADVARRQAEAAKNQSSSNDASVEEAQRLAAIEAYREAERVKQEQQATDAAAERLRAAEAEYQAELARRSQR